MYLYLILCHCFRPPLLIQHFSNKYPNVSIGFADHALPESALRYALASVAIGAGATVLEKHFTHDKTLPGNDHYHAMDKEDLKHFIHVWIELLNCWVDLN